MREEICDTGVQWDTYADNVEQKNLYGTRGAMIHEVSIAQAPQQIAWTSKSRNQSPVGCQLAVGLPGGRLRILGERGTRPPRHRHEVRPERKAGEP